MAYFIIRGLHIALFAAASEEVQIRGAVRTLATTAIPAPALLIVAGLVDEGSARAAMGAPTFRRTWPGPGCGRSISRSSGGCGFCHAVN